MKNPCACLCYHCHDGLGGACLGVLFGLVKNKEHWKLPINAKIRLADLAATGGDTLQLERAINYFSGGGVRIKTLKGGMIRVRAPGYYNNGYDGF